MLRNVKGKSAREHAGNNNTVLLKVAYCGLHVCCVEFSSTVCTQKVYLMFVL